MSFSTLIDGQLIHFVPSLELECGSVLKDVPIAYKTWGTLDAAKSNVMIICHAFTGSADVEDWYVLLIFCTLVSTCGTELTRRRRWGPLIGTGRVFDATKFFIVCVNVLGSPYGTASPVTIKPETGKPYGPDFPPTSIRDDVRRAALV